jgi:hypothetical protein
MPSLVQPGEENQLLDEVAHPARFLLDPLHCVCEVVGPRRRAAPEQLGVPADDRDRGAQLVRGVRDEPPQPFLRPFSDCSW